MVLVVYDPDTVTYAELLNHFWHNVDPLTANAQFCDKGSQYRTAIFSDDEQELAQARASKEAIEKELGKPVVTQIAKAGKFTRAEEYHQDYYAKNSLRYNYYRHGCGRDKRLKELWGSKSTH
jgi:peptide-methionine (S)-S-oxide reductase